MTQQQAFEVMRYVTAVWTQREMSEAQILAYIENIEDLPYEAVALAVRQLTASETWMPSIALLRTTATELLPGQRMAEPDAAWNEVCEQIRSVGSKRGLLDWSARDEDGKPVDRVIEPEFTHPAIAQVVESLGWDELCSSENVIADRAHFMKLYTGAVERHRREQNMTPAARALQSAVAGLNLHADRELPESTS